MARTFSYQRHLQHRKQPPLRACYRTTSTTKYQRGPFADLADKVHQKYRQATGKGGQPPAEKQGINHG